jgi:hypothetical protein
LCFSPGKSIIKFIRRKAKMKLVVKEKATGKIVNPPNGGYEYGTEGIVLGLDGKFYEVRDNGECGDPECCGERTYSYHDVTKLYKVEYV